MLPALLAAKPLIKYGVPALILALLVAAYFGWREYQQWQGAKEEKERQQLALFKQRDIEARSALERLEDRNRIVDETHQELQKLQTSLEVARHEIERYKKTKDKPCVVTREFVTIHDTLSRVPDVSAASDGSVGSGRTSAEPAVQAETAAEDVRVIPLSAFLELRDEAIERLRTVEREHEGLSLFVLNEYRKAKALRDQQLAGSHE